MPVIPTHQKPEAGGWLGPGLAWAPQQDTVSEIKVCARSEAEQSPSMHEALGSIPSTPETRMLSAQHSEVEAGERRVQGHPHLHTKFEASLILFGKRFWLFSGFGV